MFAYNYYFCIESKLLKSNYIEINWKKLITTFLSLFSACCSKNNTKRKALWGRLLRDKLASHLYHGEPLVQALRLRNVNSFV